MLLMDGVMSSEICVNRTSYLAAFSSSVLISDWTDSKPFTVTDSPSNSAEISTYFPEIYILDTGSTDKTLDKVKEITKLFVGEPQETITLQDGRAYVKNEIDSKLLKKLGYTAEEIGKILKEI